MTARAMRARLGILLSGRGSNFQAIHRAILADAAFPAEIAVVVSNKSTAGGLGYAEEHGIPAAFVRPSDYDGLEAYDAAIVEILKARQVDVLILAGYTKILSPVLLAAYEGRILNIHPSLLPDFGGHGMWGERVHQAVIAAKSPQSGCTVHLVTEEVDAGPILGQTAVPVYTEDTPEILAARVLAEEHRLYPAVIREFVLNRLEVPHAYPAR